MIDPRALLRHARAVVEHHEAQGRPRQVWLRRGVSAAYYAVFNRLALSLGGELLPQAASAGERVARALDHAAVRAAADLLDGKRSSKKDELVVLVELVKQDARLVQAVLDARQLQQKRHDADYDHLATFSKRDALDEVARAERALDGLEAVSASRESRRALAVLLVLLSRRG